MSPYAAIPAELPYGAKTLARFFNVGDAQQYFNTLIAALFGSEPPDACANYWQRLRDAWVPGAAIWYWDDRRVLSGTSGWLILQDDTLLFREITMIS